MEINVLIIPIIATLLSCKNNLSRDADYFKQLNWFNKELVDHFPREGEYKSFSIEIDTVAYYNTLSVVTTVELSKEDFNKVVKNFKQPLIDNGNQNIVVVNSFLNKRNFPEPATVFCGQQCIDTTTLKDPFFVLPNFYLNKFSDSSTNTKLSNEFKHLLIDQNTGIYSKKIEADKSTMPLNLFHGFSKGISINENKSVVIYWTIIW